MAETQSATYTKPATIKEAWQALTEAGEAGRIVWVSPRPDDPAELEIERWVDLSSLALDQISSVDGGTQLGSNLSLTQLHQAGVLQSTFGGLVAQAARKTAHHGLRNLAKLGAVVLEPAAAPELASALLSCDSQVSYFAGSEKTKPLSEYFSQAGEKGIPLAVTLDQEKGGQAQSSIQWLGRSPMDRAMIVVAASAQFEGEKINWLRLAAAADGYSPTRLIQVEEMLEGKALSSLSQDALTTALRQSVEPQESFRASAEYQKEMTALLGWRAIQDIAGKVGA